MTLAFGPAPVERVRPRWDAAIAIGLLVFGFGLTAIASTLGVSLVFFADGCGASAVCNTGQLSAGMLVAGVGVWAPMLAAIVVAVLLLVFRRRGMWAAIVGLALVVATWLVGFALVLSAISPSK